MPASAVPELHTSVPLGVEVGEEVLVFGGVLVFEGVLDDDDVLELESVMLSLMVIESVSPSDPITKG